MPRILALIEVPTNRLFHFMHNVAEKRAYKKDVEYKEYSDVVEKYSTETTIPLATDENPLLTTSNYFEMKHTRIYKHSPWLQWFWNIQHWAKMPSNWWSELCAAWQRVRKGYDYGAVWNVFWWHADIMAKILTDLRDKGYAWPGEGYEDFSTPEEWRDILNAMIDGFHSVKELEDLYTPEEREPYEAKFKHGMELFQKYYFHLWD